MTELAISALFLECRQKSKLLPSLPLANELKQQGYSPRFIPVLLLEIPHQSSILRRPPRILSGSKGDNQGLQADSGQDDIKQENQGRKNQGQ